MSEPTFGYTSAERDGLRVMKVVSGKNVNGHSLPDTNASSVTVTIRGTVEVFAGALQSGMYPVRVECWVSAELLEEV